MTIASVQRGPRTSPPRVLVQGVEKVGKSSFAAGASGAVFVCPEDGVGNLDVARFPEPATWQEMLDAIDELRTQPHDFQYLVLDTLDWLEPLCWAHCCARDGKKDLESYGYGRGVVVALDEWRTLLAKLEKLRGERGMGVIMLAHSSIRTFRNPTGPDFDRYELKLDRRASGLVKEWCDAILFAAFEEYVDEDRNKRVRGVSTGARILHTERSAAWDAGNRFNLPPTLPLEWDAYAEAVAANRTADPETLRARITAALTDAEPALRTRVETAVNAAGDDAPKLARILNHLAATLAAKETNA
jgi:hypothetical protein